MAGKGDLFIAIESGTIDIKGQLYPITKGVTTVRAGHDLLKKHGAFFAPLEQHVTYDVEQATAAPGEKRTRSAKK